MTDYASSGRPVQQVINGAKNTFIRKEKLMFNRLAPSYDLAQKLADFREHGYVVFEEAIADDLLDGFWADVETHLRENPALRFSIGQEILDNKARWSRADLMSGAMPRIINIEHHAQTAPSLFLHPTITTFLRALYGSKPSCLQTLTFEKGSQQGPHADKYLVSPGSVGLRYDRDTLAASWIACEDADEENGALILFPGSHKLPKKKLGDDITDYGVYSQHLEELCEVNNCSRQTFVASKGDVLFWHADFVHAGGPIKNQARTRRTLVSHYAKLPFWHRAPDRSLRRRAFGGGSYFVTRRDGPPPHL